LLLSALNQSQANEFRRKIYEILEKSLEMTEKDEYQSIFDLTSCYYLHSTRVKQMNLEGRFMKYWKNL